MDAARTAPAVARNRAPIADVLRRVLPERASVLEVASGTGEHAVWFCGALPGVTWQPTDRDPQALASIAAWRAQAGLANLMRPLALDAMTPARWPALRPDAVVAINMIHVAPWAATEGLMRGAARTLSPGGLLCLYGPFRVGGAHRGAGNAGFDAELRARDPAWGVRDLDAVRRCASAHGLALRETVEMPANNLCVVLRRA